MTPEMQEGYIPEYEREPERTCRERPWDSWKIIQDRALTCPILAHYCAAYKIFGPDANVSREMFLGDLVLALHDVMTKYRGEVLRLLQEEKPAKRD